ncbi:hypothetical protein PMAYCL1PPCAC_27004, partial [Pristionchus mayeri]
QIHPPGYPHPNIPCENTLLVEKGKLVELTVSFLEANICCDYLEILDGFIGSNIIANLTGTTDDLAKKTYTSSSNSMRIKWVPNGAVNVRGF